MPGKGEKCDSLALGNFLNRHQRFNGLKDLLKLGSKDKIFSDAAKYFLKIDTYDNIRYIFNYVRRNTFKVWDHIDEVKKVNSSGEENQELDNIVLKNISKEEMITKMAILSKDINSFCGPFKKSDNYTKLCHSFNIQSNVKNKKIICEKVRWIIKNHKDEFENFCKAKSGCEIIEQSNVTRTGMYSKFVETFTFESKIGKSENSALQINSKNNVEPDEVKNNDEVEKGLGGEANDLFSYNTKETIFEKEKINQYIGIAHEVHSVSNEENSDLIKNVKKNAKVVMNTSNGKEKSDDDITYCSDFHSEFYNETDHSDFSVGSQKKFDNENEGQNEYILNINTSIRNLGVAKSYNVNEPKNIDDGSACSIVSYTDRMPNGNSDKDSVESNEVSFQSTSDSEGSVSNCNLVAINRELKEKELKELIPLVYGMRDCKDERKLRKVYYKISSNGTDSLCKSEKFLKRILKLKLKKKFEYTISKVHEYNNLRKIMILETKFVDILSSHDKFIGEDDLVQSYIGNSFDDIIADLCSRDVNIPNKSSRKNHVGLIRGYNSSNSSYSIDLQRNDKTECGEPNVRDFIDKSKSNITEGVENQGMKRKSLMNSVDKKRKKTSEVTNELNEKTKIDFSKGKLPILKLKRKSRLKLSKDTHKINSTEINKDKLYPKSLRTDNILKPAEKNYNYNVTNVTTKESQLQHIGSNEKKIVNNNDCQSILSCSTVRSNLPKSYGIYDKNILSDLNKTSEIKEMIMEHRHDKYLSKKYLESKRYSFTRPVNVSSNEIFYTENMVVDSKFEGRNSVGISAISRNNRLVKNVVVESSPKNDAKVFEKTYESSEESNVGTTEKENERKVFCKDKESKKDNDDESKEKNVSIRKKIVNNYSQCNTLVGKFKITHDEWKKIYDNEKKKLKQDTYGDFLRDKFLTLEKGCVLGIQKKYSSKKYFMVIRLYCRHALCKRIYMFQVKESSKSFGKTVKVLRNNVEKKHITPIANQLKGAKRDAVKELLAHDTAMNVRKKFVNSGDTDAFLQGNLQEVHSDKVYQKANSERLMKSDEDRDDMVAIVMKYRNQFKQSERFIKKYIQMYGEPLVILLFCDYQIEIVQKLRRTILHLDATGSMLKRLFHEHSMPFYYAGVVNTGSRIFPAFEFFLNKQDTASIANCLRKYRYHCEIILKKWPLYRRVVTDFSFAIINAILEAFNLMSLLQYLKYCYKIITDPVFIHNQQFVFVNLCCNHVIKIFTTTIGKLVDRKLKLKHFVVEVLDAMLRSRELDTIRDLFVALCIVLSCKTETKDYEEAMKVILTLSFVDDSSEELTGDDNNYKIEVDDDFPIGDVIYKNSPFKIDFENAYENKKIVVNFGNEGDAYDINKYYCPRLIEVILRRFIAYLPLWSGLMLFDETIEVNTNAPVENHFRTRKHKVGDLRPDDKICRVIESFWGITEFLCKEEIFNIRKSRCTKTDIPIETENEENSRECNVENNKFYPTIENNSVHTETGDSRSILKSSESENDSGSNFDKVKSAVEKWGKSSKQKEATIKNIDLKNANKIKSSRSYSQKNTLRKEKALMIERIEKQMPKNESKKLNSDVETNMNTAQDVELLQENLKSDNSALCTSSSECSYKEMDELNQKLNDEKTAKNTMAGGNVLDVDGNEYERKNMYVSNANQITGTQNTKNVGKDSSLNENNKLIRLPNNLVKDYNYYCDLECGNNYYITYHPLICYKDFLRRDDIKRLMVHKHTKSMYLSDGIIDLYINLLLKELGIRENVFFLSTYESTTAFNGSDRDDLNVYKHRISDKMSAIFTYNKNEHFMLFYANIIDKKFTFFDSLHQTTLRRSTLYLKRFVNYLIKLENSKHIKNEITDYKDYKIEMMQHPKQNDGFNCGIYVLYYVECLLRRQTIDLNFNPVDYRIKVLEKFLETSEDVLNFCPHCSQQALNVTANWVSCVFCERWYHANENCIHASFEDIDTENFICELCMTYPSIRAELSKKTSENK